MSRKKRKNKHSSTHPESSLAKPTPLQTTTPLAEAVADAATPEPELPRWLTRTLTTLAYGIPLAFLAYVLYINYLPFGYEKTFTIDVGTEGDTDSRNDFYLESSRDLSERQVAEDGTTYRELNGLATAVFRPDVVLKDAQITVSVEGDGVSIIPPYLDFNPKEHQWDYSWDLGKSIPKDLTGNAFVFDGEVTFNGRDTRLELPNSANLFETGPFTLYAEWTPKDSEGNAQQIVGHFNWELWQNTDSVEFRVGRMNNATGTTYSIKHPIKDKEEFFNSFHSALAIYNPSENGYIALYLDGEFVGRTSIGSDIIWTDYGNQNFTFGWTTHNYRKSPNFKGLLHTISITSQNVLPNTPKANFSITTNEPLDILLISPTSSTLRQLKLNAKQE